MTEIKRDVKVTGPDAHGVRGTFYTKSIHNKARSLKEGGPRWDPVIYLQIDADADNKTGWDFKLRDPEWYAQNSQTDPRERWAAVWKRFEEGASGEVEGTPLSSWAYIPDHRVRELNALGILSLEQLGNLPDVRASKLGPDGTSLRDGAKKFLEPADMHMLGLQRENERMRHEMETLRSEFAQLQKQRFGDEEGEAPIEMPAKRKYTKRQAT